MMHRKVYVFLLPLLAAFTTAESPAVDNPLPPEQPPLKSFFPGKLYNAEGEEVPFSALDGKLVGIYFSAHWCGPCRMFTPQLVQYHEKYADDFEVVFVSSDRDEPAYRKYMTDSEMPWLALGWSSEEGDALAQRFRVSGIPTLVLVKPDGTVLSREGRRFVMEGTPASDLKNAVVEVENYRCGYCSKDHQREKLVFRDSDQAQP